MSRSTQIAIRWYDAVLIAALVVVIALGSPHAGGGTSARQPDLVAILIGVAGALTLLPWRRMPVLAASGAAIAVLAYLALGYAGGPVLLLGPVAMALVGYAASWWVALGAAFAISVAVVAGQILGTGEPGAIAIAGPAWAFALMLAGQLLAIWSEHAAAQRERVRLMQRQAADRERLEIARDLHDSVAHALVTVTVQADVAAKLLDRRPEQARAAIGAIRQAGADALDELGSILTALRDEQGGAQRLPARRLSDVEELVARARADGLEVVFGTEGDLAAVATAISGAAYRVVQEALSNVVRHAGRAARVEVSVMVAEPRAVRVIVSDDGGSPDSAIRPPGSRLGLIGMRERVVATGGTFTAGPRPDARGFVVEAEWG
ncbi:histidine kinase dimerization and phosphoacceptor region [Gordonia bronchialis DSM 43247]|uniref:histidine kinase n=1 Tax=Gordonia bronchialis (strain ATCC 25592 / DSM 43247 / BCRC 13721 / JCM 3198 / KCTC 3076 / NBRC 16047 / NCTC 10667) TaxID=526226 RepID=D0L4Q5_GORB4|nr:histidine kinase [Gordonia bronchialis]ACY23280.1 histidine kinase dimerization and phosphoacceptor region [Gordonia bronchialis DSM 43247]MCC3321448.1 two-component sensor histidine kinase [Gordonia bronchialis]QGS23330.1 two-component sensor histidine kinase [Gordonia bronchialis]STQ66251.1 Sensor histidine kinase desK [Gordonia bronchialis]